MKNFAIGISLFALLNSCNNAPKLATPANFFSDFIKKKLIKAEPDKYSYRLKRHALPAGKVSVEALYTGYGQKDPNKVDFTFDKKGQLECLTPVADKNLYGKLEEMARRFYKLNILAFAKDHSGNATYYFASNDRPRLVEIRDMDAYKLGHQPVPNLDPNSADYKRYIYANVPNDQITQYMGDFYIERTPDIYWGGTW